MKIDGLLPVLLSLILTSCLFTVQVLADDGVYRDAGAAACAFLKMDVGAEAAALAGTGILNGGRLAVFGNPALLAAAAPSVTIGHSEWFGTTTQDYIAGVFSIGGVVTSTAFRILHTGGLEYREEATGDPLDTFSAWNLSLCCASALRLGMFDLGAGIKILRERVWTKSSDGIAFDAGLIVHPLEELELAAAFQNIGPMITMVDDSFRLPFTWRFGARYTYELPPGRFSVTGEVSKAIDYTPRASAAVEYSPVNWAAIRTGYRFFDESQDFTAGAGLTAGGWTLDYAYVPGRYALGTAHRFTLSRSI
jgi:hypothetical protein